MSTSPSTTETDASTAEPTEAAADARSREGELAQTSRLATIGLVLGVMGGTAVIFGGVLYALDPEILPISIGNWVFGAIGLLFYSVTNYKSLLRAAGGRSTALVVLEVGIIVGVIAAVATINYFAAQSPKEWDLTRDGLYSLHEQSIKVASAIEEDITVYAFFRSSESAVTTIRETLTIYEVYTDRLKLEVINPDSPPPELVGRFDLNQKSPRIVFAAESGAFAKIRLPTEEAITNALIQVSKNEPRKVYFLTGHGEAKLTDLTREDGYSQVASALRNEGYSVEELSMVDRENIPSDASVVIIAGAVGRLFSNEVEALTTWLKRGGAAVVLLEPGIEYGLDSLFRPFGIIVGDNIVLEPNALGKAQGFGMESPIVQQYEPHPITNKLQTTASLFYRARSVRPNIKLANLNGVTLIRTSENSWAETGYRDVSAAPARDENDEPGPVPIAVAMARRTGMAGVHGQDEGSDPKNEGRLVVFGDMHFANNRFIIMGGHQDLFVNAASWAMGEEERITIRPKPPTGDRLTITQAQQYGIMFFSVNLLPLLIIGFGFSVWATRRRK